MKTLNFQFFTLVFTCFFLSCNIEKLEEDFIEETNTTEAYQELNIPYGDDVNQKFDIYLPANRNSSTKSIILLHGGGWSSGDKSDLNYLKDLIAQDFPDVAVINMNYKLADADNPPFPMQINDISSVINYLKSKAGDYNISDNYGFIGVSAGAHLALLWSYAFDTQSNINMVCSIVGPTNFTDPAYINNTSPELQVMLNLFGTTPDITYLESASPYHQVTSDAPPTILFYGGIDPLIPTSQGTDLRDKLESLNVTHQFTLYPNEGHGWTGVSLFDTWNKVKLFTETHL